ncbi:MAG: ESX secretion-associated protein EspG, partial [Thermocrispum sp.]
MQFSLSLVAVNIVLGDLKFSAPEPFDVPHPTQDTDERARLREVVYRDLERRGLMRRGRLDADVEQLLA